MANKHTNFKPNAIAVSLYLTIACAFLHYRYASPPLVIIDSSWTNFYSVRNAVVQPVDVLVVDGGSSDDTVQKAQSLGATVSLHPKPNQAADL